MDENLNIPEKIRVRIDEMILEANPSVKLNPVFHHMLTQVCFEMYKAGWRDCQRAAKLAIELTGDMFDRK